MTSYDFEKAAKNAVRKEFAKGGINFTISDIDFVWIAHELGYKKCTIWGAPMGNKYAEVTYNRDKGAERDLSCAGPRESDFSR